MKGRIPCITYIRSLYLVFQWRDLGPGVGEGALVSALSGGGAHPTNPLKMGQQLVLILSGWVGARTK